MKNYKEIIKNITITSFVLLSAFFVSEIIQESFNVQENIPAIFVFAVFLISFFTDGYLYGIISAFLVPFIMNYAFTAPFFVFDFHEVVNIVSSITLIIISILTSMMTIKIKKQEADKAEIEKEKMRANLLRAISHDLRTPLTNIYGSASILMENQDSISPQQIQNLLLGIKEDSGWLVHMVENLLSITKVNSEGIELSKQTVVLEELVHDVLLKLKKQYPHQKIELDLPEEIIMIPMDILLIEQVLLNLLENAILHAKNMTKLTLRIFLKENKAIFEIEDNGCGIQKNQTPEISDNKKHNMGIGMTVCSTIIKAHGSQLYVENVKTGGMKVWFGLETEELIHE